MWHFFCGRSAEQGSRTLVGATALRPESHDKLWRNDIIHLSDSLLTRYDLDGQ